MKFSSLVYVYPYLIKQLWWRLWHMISLLNLLRIELFFFPLQASFSELTYCMLCVYVQINKLAAVRINAMVERLQLSQQIRESVYCLFQQILNQRTSLFFNRHIDQIILCCFYGVAKVLFISNLHYSCLLFIVYTFKSHQFFLFPFIGMQISQLNLTFREIIYNYRKQPQCKPQVFRSVFVDWASARQSGVCC